MKLHLKEQRQKEVYLIQKRKQEIYAEQRNLGYDKLYKPVKYGWFKEIIITEKVERYQHKKYILELYKTIEQKFWGKTKENAEALWVKQTANYLIYNNLPTISKKQFNKLSEKAQSMCTPFRYKTERKKYKVRFYIRIPKNAYSIKFTRAYITHFKRINSLLESELNLLEQQLLKNGYFNINTSSWKYDWETCSTKKDRLQARKELRALKQYPIEDILNNVYGKEIERERSNKNWVSTK